MNLKPLIVAACEAIVSHETELTNLDRAIGDGDHGANMTRGFRALADEADALAALPFGEGLRKAGTLLVMKVGGASGPLYGSALMAIGKASESAPATTADAARLLEAAVEAVKLRGKSDTGAKTMLDVLAPVAAALAANPADPFAAARAAADEGLEATRPMRATKGRAAFLGERSVGHLDPGARSSALLVHAIADALEKR